MPSLPWAPSRRGASWRCGCHTRPPTRKAPGPPPPPARGRPPSLPRRARRSLGSFFERQPQPLECPAHGGGGDPDAASFLEKLAMLRQGEVGVEPDLGGQPLF